MALTPRQPRQVKGDNAAITMEETFWKLLEERPYTNIKLKDILAEAQVSKTAFYYHFTNLQDLADSSIEHEINRSEAIELADELLGEPIADATATLAAAQQNPTIYNRLKRITLLAGPHSTPRLMAALRTFLGLRLVTALGIGIKDDDTETRTTIEFIIGGMVAMIRLINIDKLDPDTLSSIEETMRRIYTRLLHSLEEGHIRGFWKD